MKTDKLETWILTLFLFLSVREMREREGGREDFKSKEKIA